MIFIQTKSESLKIDIYIYMIALLNRSWCINMVIIRCVHNMPGHRAADIMVTLIHGCMNISRTSLYILSVEITPQKLLFKHKVKNSCVLNIGTIM